MIILCLVSPCLGQAVPQRLPKPDFENGYQPPPLSVPPPRAAALEVLDLAVLAAALGLAFLAVRQRSRRGIVALSVFSVAYFGFYRGGCVCPVGSLQNVAAALANPGYALPLTAAVFFFLPLVFALWGGRTFCSGVCPFGALQDLVLIRPLRVAPWLNETLGMVPTLYLGLVILFAATGTAFLACRLDPFVTLFHRGGEARMVFYTAAVILLATVVARPYCRYLCPYGVPLGWLSAFSACRPRVTAHPCIQCRLCEEACPAGAIRQPTPAAAFEPLRAGVRRLALLLALTPVVAVAAGWGFSRLGGPLSGLHPDVRLAEQLRRETRTPAPEATVESLAFRAAKSSPAELFARADAVRDRFRTGGWVLGALLGLGLCVKLIGLSRRRVRPDYQPDPVRCLRCGRCHAYCPQGPARRESQPQENPHDQVA